MQKAINKGFTLIELLVVIAIIGILASIVLVSLGSARSKGADAGTQGNLDSIRTQAEIFSSNNNNTYTGMCADTTVANALTSAKNTSGATSANNTTLATAGNGTTVTCHVNAAGNAWAVEAPLKATTGMWCVDSTGYAGNPTGTVNLAASDVACN